MAKIGEGDARWIVSDRKDGANVNNWHWEERDLSAQCHQELKDIFAKKVVVDNDTITVTIKEVSDIAGDVCVAQRKKKIMCYFGLNLTIKYEGKVKATAGKADGKLTLPDVDHDNYNEEFEIGVAGTENDADCAMGEAIMRKEGRKLVRDTISAYFEKLMEAHSVGKAVPTSQAAAGGSPAPAPAPKPKPAEQPAPTGSETSLAWTLLWRASMEDMWMLFTDPQRASAYTRSQAKIDPRATGTFEFLGGAISGYFVEVTHPTKLQLQWRLSSWPSGKFSAVTISFEKEESGVTKMNFYQANIPEGDLPRVREGWTTQFWDPIKMMFGYNLEYK